VVLRMRNDSKDEEEAREKGKQHFLKEGQLKESAECEKNYFKCFPTSLVISNILTRDFPKTALSLSSALISRLFLGS
jgi:hypothetical protein